MKIKNKCLVIDDDKKIRDSLASLINEFFSDYEVDTAESGLEGIEKLSHKNYDICITDYEMSPKNGLEVLDFIKENHLDVLTVMLTSHTHKELLKKSITYHVFDFIEKPLNPDQFIDFFNRSNKELEEFKNRKKMEKLGEISATIVHDIYNPLTVLLARSSMLLKENQDPKTAKHLESLSRQSQQISNIISNVQEQLHHDCKKDSIVNLKEVKDILEDFREFKKIKNKVAIELPSLEVCLSKVSLYQILTNLINNSLDAISDQTEDEQWISIELDKIENNKIKILVTDSGHGIPEEASKLIFSRLYSNKKNTQGTGMGLFIINEILHNSNGSIELNKQSKNTQFVLTIPAV